MLHLEHLHYARTATIVPRAAPGVRSARVLVAMLALQATLAGCALTDHTVGAYQTVRTTPSARAGLAVRLEALEYTPTMDSEPNAVGVRKNGYNMVTAKLYTLNGPVAWLTDAITAEFGIAGIRLERDEGAEAPHLWITATQLFVEPSMGAFTAELQAVTIADARDALDGRFEEHHRFLLQTQLRRMDELDAHITTMEQRIDTKLMPYREQHTRLMQIPGVSRIVAATIIVELGVDMSIFRSASSVHASTAPSSASSGNSSRAISLASSTSSSSS